MKLDIVYLQQLSCVIAVTALRPADAHLYHRPEGSG